MATPPQSRSLSLSLSPHLTSGSNACCSRRLVAPPALPAPTPLASPVLMIDSNGPQGEAVRGFSPSPSFSHTTPLSLTSSETFRSFPCGARISTARVSRAQTRGWRTRRERRARPTPRCEARSVWLCVDERVVCVSGGVCWAHALLGGEVPREREGNVDWKKKSFLQQAGLGKPKRKATTVLLT